ncbi:hypothetical protein ACFQMH_31155 [Streptomyces viridiviolaceus]|uniref:Uncharacterized protein n=1 Tax=Streptomyces viridiviolaceus TaxID=68282 RepID=A0ABW2E7D2_9ACTN|nr:hypothetical protein [Streptomyces viridiviolaceus]
MHALDYVVLLQVMFNLASGVHSTPTTVWEQLKDRGIRSAKNARELVGKNAVYDSFGRLMEAGYVRRQQLPHPTLPGRKGPVVYEVYDNPTWNPDWSPAADTEDQAEVKPQVATLPGTPDPLFGEADKTSGQNASRNAGSVNNGSGVPGSVKRRVPAGQDASRVPGSGMASPPHPPEGEEDSSSPNPLTRASRPLPSQREGEEFSLQDVQAAEVFLQTMKAPWQAGRSTAAKNAPQLLKVMREQGWPSIHEVDRQLLEQDLLRNTVGAKSFAHVLPRWIADLRLFSVVTAQARPRATTAGGKEVCRKPGHGNAFPVGDCPECAREARPRRDGASRIDTASLIAALHSRSKGC